MGFFFCFFCESLFIAVYHSFDDVGCGDAWQIRPSCCHRERQCEANEVVHRIPDDSLIQISNLDGQVAIGAGQGAEIADMAISANPCARPFR